MAIFNLLLASNSPRRRQLLTLAGYPFTLAPVDIDESVLPGEHPVAYVRRLAEAKGRSAHLGSAPDVLILAADTTVADEGGILAKPADAAEARAMLTRLRGRPHQCYTALALCQPQTGRLLVEHCATQVQMRAYSDAEMDAYIASGDPLDKAGAYAIQHAGFHPVAALNGCRANVVGLPLCLLGELVRQFGGQPPIDLPPCPDDHHTCSVCAALEDAAHAG